MTECILNAAVQSAVPREAPALYVERGNGSPTSMLALGERQGIEFPREVIEREIDTPAEIGRAHV